MSTPAPTATEADDEAALDDIEQGGYVITDGGSAETMLVAALLVAGTTPWLLMGFARRRKFRG